MLQLLMRKLVDLRRAPSSAHLTAAIAKSPHSGAQYKLSWQVPCRVNTAEDETRECPYDPPSKLVLTDGAPFKKNQSESLAVRTSMPWRQRTVKRALTFTPLAQQTWYRTRLCSIDRVGIYPVGIVVREFMLSIRRARSAASGLLTSSPIGLAPR